MFGPLWLVTVVCKINPTFTAFTYLAAMLQPRLWSDEVQFGLAANTTSYYHIVSSAVKVGALLNVWPIMGGEGGI